MSVEPERGSPTMKMGPALWQPQRRRVSKNSRVKVSLHDARVVLDAGGLVARLGPLQRIAALVVAKRLFVLPPILERLAEGKAQVIAVGELDPRARFLGAHGRDLLVGERVLLQIGEAPVRLAVARADGGRRAVGGHCLGRAVEGLQRVRDREVQVRIAGGLREHLLVDRQRLIVAAEAHEDGGTRRAEGVIPGIPAEQFVDLFQRPLVLVAQRQHDRVVVADDTVVRFHLEHGFEQHLGIIEDVELHADLGEQPHRIRVERAFGLEIMADDLLGLGEVALREHALGGDDLRCDRGDAAGLRRRPLGIRRLADESVERFQPVPARRQSRVQPQRSLERLDGPRGVPLGDEAVPALLVQAAEFRVPLLELIERRECFRHAFQVALADRDHVERVAVLGLRLAQCLGDDQGLREVALLQQRTGALGFGVDTRCGSLTGSIHGQGADLRNIKKGGHQCPPSIVPQPDQSGGRAHFPLNA